MATSGITANTNCKDAYDRLKSGWKDPAKPSEVKRYKYIVYALNKSLTEIIVETTSEDGTWSDFLAALPENEPRWGIFDLEYEKDGLKKKILFINWSPEDTKIRPKMVYAASTGALKNSLDIVDHIQATELADLDLQTIKAKYEGRKD